MLYDVKQFRPVLYMVVLTAMTGFSMAAESQALWVVSTSVLAINALLVFRRKFRPVPRPVASLISLVAAIYPVYQLRNRIGSPIIAVGEFLVVLVLVKMWEQRSNRDFMSALLLSLLLMVASAISTASLLFGALFVTFLFLSLYCCLLFHLKTETEEARNFMVVPSPEKPTLPIAAVMEPALRENEKHIARSMRRLTGMVAAYAVACAVAVFLLFPRGTGAGMFGQIQWKSRDTLTGFSPQVGYQDFSKISQNSEQVATVRVEHDGVLMSGLGSLYLRGLTHNYYNGYTGQASTSYQWGTAQAAVRDSPQFMDDDNGTLRTLQSVHVRDREDPAGPFHTHYFMEVELYPTGTAALFSTAGPTAVRFDDPNGYSRKLTAQYVPRDGTIQAQEPLTQPLRYQVWATGNLGRAPSSAVQSSNIDPQVAALAVRPEVSGYGLVAKRAADVANHPGRGVFYPSQYDHEIAENISAYLRTRYKYTLDMSALPTAPGKDPIVTFLYEYKKGYCQYFAGAMVLMCQSLGMDARMVVGFKCEDYNDYGHFYDIRQSDAHTWVEVLTTDGWQTFDPTSGTDADTADGKSTWQKAKHFFDYLEYSWQNSVISYDADNRDNLINSMDNKLNQAAVKGAGRFGGVTDAISAIGNWLASEIVGPLVILLLGTIFGLIGWYFYERFKVRKRARRMGVDSLPAIAQAKLLRQLVFYDDLMRMLAKHQIVRAPQLTPREFSRNLTFVPGEVYDAVDRLTTLYYKIRFGSAEIDDAQQRRLSRVVSRLGDRMEPSPTYE